MDHTGRVENGTSLLDKRWVTKVIGGLDVLAERVLEAFDRLGNGLRQPSDSNCTWHGHAQSHVGRSTASHIMSRAKLASSSTSSLSKV